MGEISFRNSSGEDSFPKKKDNKGLCLFFKKPRIIFRKKINLKILFICLLILAGSWVRWIDLAWHFSHIDDISPLAQIVEQKRSGGFDLFVVPSFSNNHQSSTGLPVGEWSLRPKGGERSSKYVDGATGSTRGESTYAPFQFFFTTFLISPEQNYRDLLFWGRLPSCLFSILGLIALIIFYSKYAAKNSWAVISSVALLAFSWENIIFAKQSSN